MAAKSKGSVGRPVRSDKDNKTVSTVEQGTKPGERRKAYIVNSELADKIDAIAYWDRVNIKDVVHEAFSDRVAKYERKNGAVKPMKK